MTVGLSRPAQVPPFSLAFCAACRSIEPLAQLISVSGGLEAGLSSLAREIAKASDDTALDAKMAFGVSDFRRSLAGLSALR